MLAAAPESRFGGAGDIVQAAVPTCFDLVTLPALADRSVRPTWASSKRVAWASLATYSVAGVNSSELAKSEPMLPAFSAELAIDWFAIHWLSAAQMERRCNSSSMTTKRTK